MIGTGPGGRLLCAESESTVFGEAAARLREGEGAFSGGGSIECDDRVCLVATAGSGSAAISSSAVDVSMVTYFVVGAAGRCW